MSERLKYQGRRQELELRKKELEIKIAGKIDLIRDAADPLEKPGKLKTTEIVTHAIELAELQDKYNAVQADLDRIAEILGR
jgi:sensor domain CHASE-containing protein